MNAECQIRCQGKEYSVEIEHLHHLLFLHWSLDKLHSHPAYHLILISQGDCYVQFQNLAPIFVKQNDLIFINPNVPHLFIPNEETGVEHTSCIWRFRDHEGNYGVFPLQALSDEPDTRDFIIKPLTALETSTFLRLHRQAENYYNESRNEFKLTGPDEKNTVSLFDASSSFFRLWLTGYSLIMERNSKIPKLQTSSKSAIVENIHKLVEMNFSLANFNINNLAQELHMHPNYLNTVFTRETGYSIGQLLRNYRLEYAKDLLLRTPFSIANIAAKAGFSRHNYFARIFKAATGMTPHEFRKQPPPDHDSI